MVNIKFIYKWLFTLASFVLVGSFVSLFILQRSGKTDLAAPLPGFTLPALFNKASRNPFTSSLGTPEGKIDPIYIVHFWASWCPPCKDEMPSLLRVSKRLPSHVHIITVSLDESANEAERFLKSLTPPYDSVVTLIDQDRTTSQTYGTIKLPETYILNKDRQLLRKIAGPMDWENPLNFSYLNNLGKP